MTETPPHALLETLEGTDTPRLDRFNVLMIREFKLESHSETHYAAQLLFHFPKPEEFAAMAGALYADDSALIVMLIELEDYVAPWDERWAEHVGGSL